MTSVGICDLNSVIEIWIILSGVFCTRDMKSHLLSHNMYCKLLVLFGHGRKKLGIKANFRSKFVVQGVMRAMACLLRFPPFLCCFSCQEIVNGRYETSRVHTGCPGCLRHPKRMATTFRTPEIFQNETIG